MLLSNSRDEAGRFLHHARDEIAAHLGSVSTVAFVPYAGVTVAWNDYTARVRDALTQFGVTVVSVHETSDARALLQHSDAVVIGGGNTFHLLAHMQRARIDDVVRQRVLSGVPYLGWSAGSVVACPTMQTTNDMPITQPESFAALGLVGFQINAHFTDSHPPGFQGETRRQRLAEYVAANSGVTVLGLPEGTWLQVTGASVVLRGRENGVLFRADGAGADVGRDVELGAMLEG